MGWRKFRLTQILWILLKSTLVAGAVSILFYNNLYGVIPGGVIALYVLNEEIKAMKQKRKSELTEQFKNMVIALAGALSAGYSLENAFTEVQKDMLLMYPVKKQINTELEIIIRKIKVHICIDEAIKDFGIRSGIEEVLDFANVLETIRKTGGNTVSIIRNTVEQIRTKIELDREIQVMVAAKKLEQGIMTYMPFAIVAYLRIANKGYLAPLYDGFLGIGFMTACLLFIIFADYIGKRIVNII